MRSPFAPTRRSLIVAGAVAASGLGVFAPGTDARDLIVTIDASLPGRPFPHYWESCVGSDHAIVGMRADWRRDLDFVHREAGFRSVRFHGLLDDDMGICRDVGPDGPILNFLYLDQIFDAMLAIGVRPFVELSFMPRPLASSDNTVFWYKGNTSPPNSFEN